jgi:hypothetical protein
VLADFSVQAEWNKDSTSYHTTNSISLNSSALSTKHLLYIRHPEALPAVMASLREVVSSFIEHS